MQSFLDGGLQFLRAVQVKQFQHRVCDRTDIGATLGGPDHQRLAGRHGARQAVEAAMLARLALDCDESLEVLRVLDLLVTIIAATVTGDHLCAVEDADQAEIGAHAERAPDMSMRYRVIVEVEAHIGRFADPGGDLLLDGVRVGGQRQKQWLLLRKRLADRYRPVLGAWPVGCLVAAPLFGLGIQIVEIGELAGDEECFPYICRMARSTRPFSLPRATATGRGSNR